MRDTSALDSMSFDLQHQIWPVEHDPKLIEDIATEQDVGLIITGQNLDHAGRQIADLNLDQERRESCEMSTDSEDWKFAELVEMQLVGQSPRYDRQIGGSIELSGAFRDGRIHRDRPNRHVDEWCWRRDLSVVSVTAHFRDGPRPTRSVAKEFEPASEARR